MKKQYWLIPLLLVAFIRAEMVVTPAWDSYGKPEMITYNASRRVYVDRTNRMENWAIAYRNTSAETQKIYEDLKKPLEIPAKRKLVLKLRTDLFCEQRNYTCAGMMFLSKHSQRRRLVLINVERKADYEAQYRVWPHLGILSVGTAAHEEGWEVVLWDELVQGHAPLDKLIQEDDIVGLSLIVSGIERGIDLAHEAKERGARYVIAGNDSAIFRANQLLRLPDKPIDAVFTSNSLNAVRRFFREINNTGIEGIRIADVQTTPDVQNKSNERSQLLVEMGDRKQLKDRGRFESDDVFIVPKLDLFPESYWQEVWTNYRSQFGKKHSNPTTVKNGLALLAQGCTRTRGIDVCRYCSIYGVGDLRFPYRKYVVDLAETLKSFGIDMVFNATDSAFEMRPVVQSLIEENIRFNGLEIYVRAQGIARAPQLLEEWMSVVKDRFIVNCGMDSGDDTSLKQGIVKSSVRGGSRFGENREAVLNLKKSGAHLHYSLIFGSPGETRDTCERSMEFLEWTIDTLGNQLDICETDYFWLNFGSPAAQVFHDYSYAQELAAMAQKSISREEWEINFASVADALSVPDDTEKAWYRFFTRIDYDTATEYNERARLRMEKVTGSIRGRAFLPPVS